MSDMDGRQDDLVSFAIGVLDLLDRGKYLACRWLAPARGAAKG